jgi:hypothetical protein
MKEPTYEQLLQILDKMMNAGWARAYEHRRPAAPRVSWTKDGEAALDVAWSLMNELGGDHTPGRAWEAVGYLMWLRHYGG